MPPALTISEALKDESCWHFAGTHSEQGWTCAWVARRRGWGDDLILQRPSQPPVVVAARVKVAGPPVFAGNAFAVVVDGALKLVAVDGAKVTIRRLSVKNAGWKLRELTPEEVADAGTPEVERLRGYTYEVLEERELRFDAPGEYVVDEP